MRRLTWLAWLLPALLLLAACGQTAPEPAATAEVASETGGKPVIKVYLSPT